MFRAQPILVARFLMNLREADASRAEVQHTQLSDYSPLEFRCRATESIVDIMAQTLETDSEAKMTRGDAHEGLRNSE